MRLKLLAAFLATVAAPLGAQAPVKAAYAEPSLSPDGTSIAFSSGGDIWEVPAAGGVARLLVTDAATDGRPLYSPDGTRLAFNSTRGGSNNVWVLELASGKLTRLTWAEANEELSAWSADSKYLYFSSNAGEIGGSPDVYRVAASGGQPMEVSRERYLSEYHGAPSPDGSQLALLARGLSNGQWWRNGTSHIDQNELWVRPIGAGPYRKLLADDAKHAWPMWSADGQIIWFMSGKSGVENLWTMPAAGGAARQVTQFRDGRLLYPQIGAGGSSIVFERDFGIWRLDTATGQATPVPIMLRGAAAMEGKRHLNLSNFDRMAVSPDGKKLAVIARGELFAVNAADGGQAQRITETVAAEREPSWSPDSRRILYTTERGTERWLAEFDVAANRETLLTRSGFATVPTYAPDGKSAVYLSGKKELRLITLPRAGQGVTDRLLYTGAVATDDSFGPQPVWSPDGKWIAFPVTDTKSFTNVNVVAAAGGPARPISFLGNGQMGGIAWSPDGKYILFDTSQRSEDSKIVRVDLVPHLPKYREDGFRDLFKPGESPGKPDTPPTSTPENSQAAPAKALPKAGKASPKPATPPTQIVWDGLRERVSILPLGLNASNPQITADGKTLVFVASERGQANLWSYNLDELAADKPVAQPITATPKNKGEFKLTADGNALFYLDGGTVFSTPLSPRAPKAVQIAADMDVDFASEKQVVFDEAWGTLDRNFYDPKFHGQDWAALRAKWQPYVAGARTGTELRRIMNLLIGELNASHSGMSGPAGALPTDRIGNLGLRFDRARYEAGDGLVVREVITLSPADIAGGIAVGDRITSVNGVAVGASTNLDALLENDVDRRVTLGINGARTVVLRPVSQSTATGLVYRQWVASRRALVDKLSGGRLGYVHIPDMSSESLDQLYLDLDAQNQGKQGVVVDIRNNNGGFINGYVLDVFSRRNYLTMTPRDLFALPSRQALGQRALGLPTVLLTNESSLSDAEDFSEGYRALGIGKIVGQPTAGWIIYTSGERLIDGSTVRVPQVLIEDLKGQNMEMNPRPVDIAVERPLGETLSGDDAQLAAAVRVLLGQ